MRAEGAKLFAEALKVNSTLTYVEYAAARPYLPNLANCQQPLTLCPNPTCSVRNNDLGPEGVKPIAEALKVNSTLISVEYAAACPLTFLIR